MIDRPQAEWPDSMCSYCGFDFEGVEVEYCDAGEHCEMCCTCEDEEDSDD